MSAREEKKSCFARHVSSGEGELVLHRRLVAGDPIASNDLAERYLDTLICWLQEHNPRLPFEFILQAAGDALLNLIHHPTTYNPEKLPLEKYLRMSAQGDLRNALAREKREHACEVPWNTVELSDSCGKYLGKEDDPSLPLQMAEETAKLQRSIPAAVRDKLTESELRVLELMLQGERRTDRLAEAYGIAHLEQKERARQIKRIKDKLKKRLERKGKKE